MGSLSLWGCHGLYLIVRVWLGRTTRQLAGRPALSSIGSTRRIWNPASCRVDFGPATFIGMIFLTCCWSGFSSSRSASHACPLVLVPEVVTLILPGETEYVRIQRRSMLGHSAWQRGTRSRICSTMIDPGPRTNIAHARWSSFSGRVPGDF